MATSLDQALLYFGDLRLQARTADPVTMLRLEAEVEALRKDLWQRLGPAAPLKVHQLGSAELKAARRLGPEGSGGRDHYGFT